MLIQTVERIQEAADFCSMAHTIVVDLETTGLYPYLGDRLIGIALYLPEIDYSAYIPFRHGEGFNFDLSYLELFRKPLSNPRNEYFGWNVKFDQHFLTVDGFPILERGAIYRDVIIALHTLDENRFDIADKRRLNYKLKDNARLFLGDESAEAEDILKAELKARGIKGKGDMWQLPANLVSDYAEDDVKLTWKLYQVFLPYLEKWHQVEYFNELAEFNSRVLARMEWHGVPVDRDKINEHVYKNRLATEKSMVSLREAYGENFNPNSPHQVSSLLGTKNSQRVTLERSNNPAALDIIDYKFLKKAEGTFYNPYLKYSAMDGKIHANFNAARTTSRRLSSSDPNLQQVPTYSNKYRVKEVFVAPTGWKWVEIDFSQQELRLGCYFSGQENMTQVYVQDEYDVHMLTAAHLFQIEIENVTDEQRKLGKVSNFGFSYGMGIMKAATYIASSLKKTLVIDAAFYLKNKKSLPKVKLIVDESKPEEAIEVDMTWEEFVARFEKYYAGTIIRDDAKEYERINPETSISIWTTTRILWDWKDVYEKFTEKLYEYSELASSYRTVDGEPTKPEHGYRFIRLDDGCVRHYIKGQRPFTAWNFLIQGTGASIMRKSLLRINDLFPISQDEVKPIISVHDSIIFLIRDNENLYNHIRTIKSAMEDFPQYWPPMRVDVKIGQNWGHTEKWHE